MTEQEAIDLEWCALYDKRRQVLDGLISITYENCPGKQYQPALVERIARIFYDSDAAAMAPAKPVSWEFVLQDPDRSPWHKAAVAVLDALNDWKGET
jgi:hypothetical protein